MAAILNLAILDSATLVFPVKLTHTCQDWFPPFAQKKTLTHLFWLNLMMAVILNSAILDSDTLFSSLRFTQKHSHSTLILTQSNSIWLKLIHSDSTWWWQPSWILPCWIQTPCFLLSDSLQDTLTPLWLWLKVIQSDSILFILIQLDDGSHLGFSHLSFSLSNSLHLPGLVPTIAQKKPSLIHSDSTWWWQPFWILPCWIKKLHSFILTQLDDGSHLEFCNVWLKNFTHSFWLNLMMAAILNSAMFD